MENLIQKPFHFIIFTDGTKTFAQNNQTGEIEFHGTDASEVIKNTLKGLRSILIKKGVYSLSRPVEMVSNLDLVLEEGAVLEFPSDYRDAAVRFGNSVRFSSFTGGILRLSKPPQMGWTGFHLQSSGGGVLFNAIHNVEIWRPKIGILLEVSSEDGWINGNDFRSIRIAEPEIFIDFDMTVPWKRGQNGFNRNHFQNIFGQSGPETTFGARSIRHLGNLFLDVRFWDLSHPEGVSASVHPDAEDTIILGGIMTQRNFVNQGLRTQVIDPFHGVSLDDVAIWSSRVSMEEVTEPGRDDVKRLVHGLLDTPVVQFKRSPESPHERLGVVAESAPPVLLSESNPEGLSLPSYVANLHLAFKEQQRQIQELRMELSQIGPDGKT